MIHCIDKIPIVVICKDRVRYLDTTLKSLSASVPKNTPVFIMNDGTQNEAMIRYLTTNDTIPISGYEYPNQHKEWQHFVGRLPNEKTVQGIRGKAHVLMMKPGGISNIGYACKQAFETGSRHIIKIEDDILLTKDWYNFLFSALSKTTNIGLISGWRYFYGKPRTVPLNDKLELLKTGYTGGCLFAASRELLEKQPKIFINKIKRLVDNDDFWIDHCRMAKLKMTVTNKGLCQHIGVITEAKHKEYMLNNKIIKVDKTLRGPFELASEVREF